MTDAKWDPDKFNKLRVDLLQANKALAMKPAGSISIDDVETLHYGAERSYVGYQYSSTLGKTVKSTKFVNLHYHDDEKDYHLILEPYQINKNVSLSPNSINCETLESFANKISNEKAVQDAIIDYMTTQKLTVLSLKELENILIPVAVKPKVKRKALSKLKRLSPDFESKISLAIQAIKYIAKYWGVKGMLFLGDAWYATILVIETIRNVEANYLMRLKDNRILVLENGDKVSVHGLVTSRAEAFVSINETTTGFFETVRIPELGYVTLVVLRDENGDRSFITNLSPEEGEEKQFLAYIAKCVKSHWTIEEGHKKLNTLGLDKYCGFSSAQSLKKHVALVLFRYTFLVFLSVKDKWKKFVSNVKSSGRSVLNTIYKLVNLFLLEERCQLKVQNMQQESIFSEIFA